MTNQFILPQPTLSYSSASLYSKCPYGYKLKYIDRLIPVAPDFTNTTPGNVAHKLAELFYKHKEISGNPNLNIFDELFDDVFNHYINKPDVHLENSSFGKTIPTAYKNIRNWTKNLKEMLVDENLIQGTTISEFFFGTHNNPILLTPNLKFCGAPDLIHIHPNTSLARLVDYKASDSTFHLNDAQLFLYSAAVKKAMGIDISMAVFILFKGRKRIYKTITPERIQSALDWASGISDNIRRGQFSATPSQSTCRFCQYKDVCKYHAASTNQPTIKSPKESKDADVNTSFSFQPPEL